MNKRLIFFYYFFMGCLFFLYGQEGSPYGDSLVYIKVRAIPWFAFRCIPTKAKHIWEYDCEPRHCIERVLYGDSLKDFWKNGNILVPLKPSPRVKNSVEDCRIVAVLHYIDGREDSLNIEDFNIINLNNQTYKVGNNTVFHFLKLFPDDYAFGYPTVPLIEAPDSGKKKKRRRNTSK